MQGRADSTKTVGNMIGIQVGCIERIFLFFLKLFLNEKLSHLSEKWKMWLEKIKNGLKSFLNSLSKEFSRIIAFFHKFIVVLV
jgi:hypothetical protein